VRSSPYSLFVAAALATACGLATPPAAVAAAPAAVNGANLHTVSSCFGTICVEWNGWGLPVPTVVELSTAARLRVKVAR
jgi:spore maturation protein SpmB